MRFKIFPLIVISFIVAINGFARKLPSNKVPTNTLFEINNQMELLDDSIQSENDFKSCIHSQKAHQLIQSDLKSLKRLEPYYQWEEIINVLETTSNMYCRQGMSNQLLKN